MALSAVTRLQEDVNLGILIDVLRGSGRYEILDKGYDKIKTYGAGRNIPYTDWQSYIWQMIQLGLLEIAYDDKHKLKLTPASKDVLFNNKKIELFKPLSIKERQEIEQKAKEQKAQKEAAQPRLRIRNELFDALRDYRRQLAIEMGVPPYIVFSDATLAEMAANVPRTEGDFRRISGVGEQKWEQFGSLFLNKIAEFLKDNPDFVESGAVNQVKPPPVKDPKIPTQMQTLDMWKQGMSIEEIAEARFLSPTTISTHLLHFYENDVENIDIYQFITAEEIMTVLKELHNFEEPYKLKEIFEYFGGIYGYEKIRFALAYQKKNSTEQVTPK
jgi:ATP-dependent DNA helicase RecQ